MTLPEHTSLKPVPLSTKGEERAPLLSEERVHKGQFLHFQFFSSFTLDSLLSFVTNLPEDERKDFSLFNILRLISHDVSIIGSWLSESSLREGD